MFSSPWQFLIACLAAWIHREQQQRLEYVQLELTVAKEMLGTKRLRFTYDQRRRLAAKAKQVGRKGLIEIGSLVTPDTRLRRHRTLSARKWTCERKSAGRNVLRPRYSLLTLLIITALVAGGVQLWLATPFNFPIHSAKCVKFGIVPFC